MSAYRVSLRELRFFLWELHQTDRKFLGKAPFVQRQREDYEALLERARAFAHELGQAYQTSDRQGCQLHEDGRVQIPAPFHGLWQRFKQDWADVLSQDPARSAPLPPLIRQTIQEMFMGANPAFMTYGGFNLPAIKLLQLHGTPAQKAAYLEPLQSYEWDACFCATERQAGSDLTAVATTARRLESGEYAVSGEKAYISAGMHSLTGNTLYFVLGRINTHTSTAYSLSCLLVPRWWPNPQTGQLEDNHVECTSLLQKMGLKGCANTQLTFGRRGITRGVLLGDRPNAGLLQLMPLMNQARMSTAIIGLGLSSSAYLHALEFASQRVQGRAIERASDASAPPVPIIEHADVQRMLLEMKARVEGCRGLLGKLTAASTQAQVLEAAKVRDEAQIEKYRKLVQLLTPVCKAFVSDQAWKVCELAIQVHGGVGYTDAYPVEQQARDVKILSIWEGTNYIQAQDLVRDKLGFGRHSRLIKYFAEELQVFLAGAIYSETSLQPLFAQLEKALSAVQRALAHIGDQVRAGRMHESSQFYTRFLDMIGFTVSAWVLLESACVAQQQLRSDLTPEQAAFYRGKIKTARYFFANLLPVTWQYGQAIEHLQLSGQSISRQELGEADATPASINPPVPASTAPRNLWAPPATRYRGTQIDGATLEPLEGLWVRGHNLNTLIGTCSFPDALWLAWQDHFPTPEQRQAVEAVLAQVSGHLARTPGLCAAIQAASASGAPPVQAAACGYLADLGALDTLASEAAGAGGLPTDADFVQGLVCVGCAPHFLQAALGGVPDAVPGPTHVQRLARAMAVSAPDGVARRVLDALLVAWHAGFGYITPTVLVPRTAIGTGVSLAQAIAAGFMASGPHHVGAAEQALAWLLQVGSLDHAALRRAVDQALEQPGAVLSGFGHPLFVADPRVPHLRALFAEWGFAGHFMQVFQIVCDQALIRKGLRPNIDFITAAALLDLGVKEARWGVGLGLSARVVAMVAHALERRDRPAFGVNSKAARRSLAAVPVGWL